MKPVNDDTVKELTPIHDPSRGSIRATFIKIEKLEQENAKLKAALREFVEINSNQVTSWMTQREMDAVNNAKALLK